MKKSSMLNGSAKENYILKKIIHTNIKQKNVYHTYPLDQAKHPKKYIVKI